MGGSMMVEETLQRVVNAFDAEGVKVTVKDGLPWILAGDVPSVEDKKRVLEALAKVGVDGHIFDQGMLLIPKGRTS